MMHGIDGTLTSSKGKNNSLKGYCMCNTIRSCFFASKKKTGSIIKITKINVTSLVLGVTPRNFARWQVVGVAFDLHDQNVYIVNINVYRSNKPLF